jgi:fibronectin type 3 domain-containing protein
MQIGRHTVGDDVQREVSSRDVIHHQHVPPRQPGHLRGRLGSLLVGLAMTVAPLGGMHALAAQPGPAIVQAQGLSDTTIELVWTAVAGATSYTVTRGTSVVATQTGTTYDDTGLAASTNYGYQVQATVSGTLSNPTSASATTQAPLDKQAPTTPGTITASSLTSSSVKLSWGGSSDNQHIEGYRILRSPAGLTSPLVDIDTTDAVTSYTAKSLQSGKKYTFGIQAIDTEDNASAIRQITITTSGSSNTTPPVKPSSVTARVFSSSRIDLYWAASTSTDISAYQILRGGTMVGRVDLPGRLNFSDNGLAAKTSYSYTVKAIDSAGNVSAASTARSATTLATGTPIVARGPYLQSVSGTAARVVWWTNIATQSVVWYGVGGLTASVTDITQTQHHVMLLGPLLPGTAYSYTAGDGTFATAAASFLTAAAAGTPFTFAALGDFGGGSPGETQNGALIAGDASQFIQTLGDNIYPEAADPNLTTTYSDYDGRLFKQFGAAMKAKTFWAADGNKEYYGHKAWWQHMSLPNNERWYSYDWGDAHILVLDTEMPFTPTDPQYQFAQADLATHQGAAWRIVALQRPPYSSSSASSSSIPVRTYLVPLFQQQNVQLVLSGNSHNYERTVPMKNGAAAAGGVTYIVSGNGGNGFNAFTMAQPSYTAFRQATTYGYLRIDVNSSALTVSEVRSDTGTIIDSTTIGGSAPPPPLAPTLQTPTPGDTKVDLSWTASSGATGYNVYRSTSSGTEVGPPVNGNVPISGTTFSDTGLTNGTTYFYVVTAENGGGESPYSNEVSATPAATRTFIFSDGFESGNLSTWSTYGGLTVDGTRPHTGSFSAHASVTPAYAKKLLPTTYTDGYFRTYFYLASGFATQVDVMRYRTSADGSLGYLYVTSAGVLGLRNDIASVNTLSTTSVSSNGWHSLEFHLTVAGTSSATEGWLDGVQVAGLSFGGQNWGTTNIGKVQIGEVASGRSYDLTFDDVVFDSQRIGP